MCVRNFFLQFPYFFSPDIIIYFPYSILLSSIHLNIISLVFCAVISRILLLSAAVHIFMVTLLIGRYKYNKTPDIQCHGRTNNKVILNYPEKTVEKITSEKRK